MKKSYKFEKKHLYFVGIGGISMSGLAKIMLNRGAKVSGSDLTVNKETENLIRLGVKFNRSHQSDNITKDIDYVIYTGAVKYDNPEIAQAKKLKIKCFERSEFLGLITKMYKDVIAISGTHGKTTTTAMIGEIFSLAGLNPTIHLGGESVNLGGNTIIGSDDLIILEACEYRNSFRYVSSSLSVITNVECDHMDFYRSLSQIYKCFVGFAKNSGKVIISENTNISTNVVCKVGSDWQAREVVFSNCGYDYKVFYKDNFYCNIRLNLLGEHNITNSLFAIASAHIYGIDRTIVSNAIENFAGVERRYENIGTISGTPTIIDYAHHPTEILSSLLGVSKAYPKVLCVFQPHTYSRTLKLMPEFLGCFDTATSLIVYKTYPAREEEIDGGRAIDLYNNLSVPKKYADNLSELFESIARLMLKDKFDVVLVLGAGDLADKLKSILQNK